MPLPPVHPGRILRRELDARGLSANRLALAMRVPSNRVTELVQGRRAISTDTAIRLAAYFGNSAQFWLNLQSHYDLAALERERGAAIRAEVSAPGV